MRAQGFYIRGFILYEEVHFNMEDVYLIGSEHYLIKRIMPSKKINLLNCKQGFVESGDSTTHFTVFTTELVGISTAQQQSFPSFM